MPATTPDKDVNLIPTLLIGVGGTGKETLMRIRKMFYEKGMGVGRDHTLVDYLVVDTNEKDLNSLNDSSLTPHMKEILSFADSGQDQEAFPIHITEAVANSYLDGGKASHPNIFSWFNEDLIKRQGASMISAGAGQNRQIARLCFFHHYDRLRKLLEHKLTSLVGSASNASARLKGHGNTHVGVEEKSIMVYIVTSIAGGTGAGVFLDMGMLVKDILPKKFANYNYNIVYYAVLPEPYLPFQKSEELVQKIKENSFAVLTEMEFFAYDNRDQKFDLSFPPSVDQATDKNMKIGYEVEWKRGEKIKIPPRFWDNCFLVDGTNEDQATPMTPDQVAQMIAEAIFLNFDETEFGTKLRSSLVNRLALTIGLVSDDLKTTEGEILFERPHSKAFSIFGLSQIYFDRAKLIRKAGFMLASRLVKDFWLRKSNIFAAALLQKSLKDFGGDGSDSASITSTGYATDPVISLGYDSLEKAILMENVDQNITRVDTLRAEARALRQQIELEQIDPLTESPIDGFMKKHQILLENSKRTAGNLGLVLREGEQRRIACESEVRKRIEVILRFRLREDGLRETEQLVKEYRGFIDRLESTAREVLSYQPDELGNWEARIHNARLIPLKRYAKVAAKKEMMKAVSLAYRTMESQYLKAAAAEILKIIHLLRAQLAETATSESYSVSIKRFLDLLENQTNGTAAFLDKRFNELHRNQNAHDENARSIGLLSETREDDLESDLKKQFTQPGGDEWDWEELEKLIVEKLKKSRQAWARNISDFGDLVLAFCPLRENQPPPRHVVEEFSMELAEACVAVLSDKGYSSKVKAVDQFFQEKADNQGNCLKVLRKHASPFMRMNNRVVSGIEKNLQTENSVVYLGIGDSKTDNAAKFIDKLTRTGTSAKLLSKIIPFQMRDDSIVLYTDRVGVPICLYDKLDDLGKEYDRSNRKKDCHIDYKVMRYKLPEIRLASPVSHGKNEQALESVLQGLIVDTLRYDDQSKGFTIQLDSGFSYPVGGNLQELVDYFVDYPKHLDELQIQIEAKYRSWSENENGQLLGVLRSAVIAFGWELEKRLQPLIDSGRITSAHANVNPIHTTLLKQIEPKIHQRLIDCGGLGWISPLIEYEKILKNRDSDLEEKKNTMAAWKEKTEGCWKIISNQEMWFPVVNSKGKLKTK